MCTRSSFRFWQKWLVVYSATCIVFAVVLAIGAETRSAFLDRALLSPFFEIQALSPNLAAYNAFTLRVIAGTMTGWGVCMLGVALGPFARREPWAWCTLAMAMVAWYLIDTTGSVLAGVWLNVFGNSVFLVAGTVPLVATRGHFFGKR